MRSSTFKETKFPGALPALEARSNQERLDEKRPGGTRGVGTIKGIIKGIESFALEAIGVSGGQFEIHAEPRRARRRSLTQSLLGRNGPAHGVLRQGLQVFDYQRHDFLSHGKDAKGAKGIFGF